MIEKLNQWYQKMLKKFDLSPIAHTHTIFREFPDSVFLFKEVEKMGSKGMPKERLLVIHIAGLFLFAKRSFPRTYQISKQIAFVDLKSMIVTDRNLTVTGKNSNFTIIHPKHLEIAAIIFQIRKVLFWNHPNLPFSLEIDPKHKATFESTEFPFTSKNVLADRFLACVIRTSDTFPEDTLPKIYKILTNYRNYAIITTDPITSPPYLSSICAAISYDQNIEEIHIRNWSMESFLPFFAILSKNSVYTRRIFMRGVNFGIESLDQSNPFNKLFVDDVKLRAEEFHFSNCIFRNESDVELFFSAFSRYKTDIKILSFYKCHFTAESINAVFQSIFFVECFHKLNSLLINGVPFFEELQPALCQLCTCEWVFGTHCVQKLSAVNCNLKLEEVIPQVFMIDSGYISVDLSTNYFLKPIKNLHSFQSVVNLNLSGCHFTVESLVSFFNVLDKYDHEIGLHLNLSKLKLENGDWNDFYPRIDSVVAPKLVELKWNKNIIPIEQFETFLIFLINQPMLSEISLSKCVTPSDKELAISYVITLINAKKLSSLDYAANENTKIGEAMHPIFEALSINTNIKSLNITGQGVKEELMLSFIDTMPKNLEEIRFDGFEPSSAESLIKIMNSILNKDQIKFASWPAKDIKHAYSKVDISRKVILKKQFEELRGRFLARYGRISSTDSEMSKVQALMTNLQTTIPSGINKKKPELSSKNRRSIHDSFGSISRFAQYDNEMYELLDDCGEIPGYDPMEMALEEIDQEKSLTKIYTDLLTVINDTNK